MEFQAEIIKSKTSDLKSKCNWVSGEVARFVVICLMRRAKEVPLWGFCNHIFKSSLTVSTRIDIGSCRMVQMGANPENATNGYFEHIRSWDESNEKIRRYII